VRDEWEWTLTIKPGKKGGPGSGHHGHAGRPGQRGGSAPGKADGGTSAGTATVPNRQELEGWYNDYSDMERGALDYYRGAGFININASLRGLPGGGKLEADELTKEMIHELDAIVSKNTLSQDSVLYRGFQPEQFGVKDISTLVGKTIQDAGFVSTSIDERTGQTFAFSHDGVMARIIAPKGTNAAYMTSSEKEALLPRGRRFRIVDVETRDLDGEPLDYVTMEVLP